MEFCCQGTVEDNRSTLVLDAHGRTTLATTLVFAPLAPFRGEWLGVSGFAL
jgi:hypothetical protein